MSGKKKVVIISEAGSCGISLHSDQNAGNQLPRLHITIQIPWLADRAKVRPVDKRLKPNEIEKCVSDAKKIKEADKQRKPNIETRNNINALRYKLRKLLNDPECALGPERKLVTNQ